MSLCAVQITPEVWLTCLTHALSTETEEIMGLLLGDTENLEDGSLVAKVWSVAPQTRSDRRKDRVETNPEQLATASAEAEKLSEMIGKRTRVIGWYHSHPHITVLPSHVDVRTQKMLQMLDDGFVGLIFSCFNENVGRIQATAFQSIISKGNSNTYINNSNYQFNNNDNNLSKNIKNNQMNVDHEFESSALDEAIQRSTLDSRSGEVIRKEIPFYIIPNMSINFQKITYLPLLKLQNILFCEEKNAFHQSLLQSQQDGKIHPLTILHNSSTYQSSLCKMIEYCLNPVISALEDRLHQNHYQLALLQEENVRLTSTIKSSQALSNSSSTPPISSPNHSRSSISIPVQLDPSNPKPNPNPNPKPNPSPLHRRSSYNPNLIHHFDLDLKRDSERSQTQASRATTATDSRSGSFTAIEPIGSMDETVTVGSKSNGVTGDPSQVKLDPVLENDFSNLTLTPSPSPSPFSLL